MRGTIIMVLLVILIIGMFSTLSFGHDYRRAYSDNPLRYVAYVFYPIGLACEYLITRPIHWLVSQPQLKKVFGHPSAAPGDILFEW